MSRVWVISEVFHPDEGATSHYMTWIARGLARRFDVCAISTTPPALSGVTRDANGIEFSEGISIYRASVPKLRADHFVTRALRAVLSSVRLTAMAWRRIGRGDAVLVVTNPPFLPGLVALICKLKRAKCVLRIDDVYPEAMIAAGVLNPTSLLVSLARGFFRCLYSLADRIIVLGRDMGDVIGKQHPAARQKIEVIPNWADLDSVMPADKGSNELLRALGLTDQFVALVAGNVGRVQGIDTIMEAATLVKDEGIHILLVGSGARVAWVKQVVNERGLGNVTLAGSRPRLEQSIFLNACDVALLSLKERMYGIGVPSRLYNYMAAGKPVIGVIDEQSEPALVIREDRIGWVVPAGDAVRLADTLREAKAVGAVRLKEMGMRARAKAERGYARDAIVARYVAVLEEVTAELHAVVKAARPKA
jgi:glycosyltransferase involved in cell wall biosynthesis